VILISASMGVTVCPARCLGLLWNRVACTNGQVHLASIISHAGGSAADRSEPAPSGLRSTHHLLQSLPAVFEALLQYLELVELVREAVLDEASAPSTRCQRKAVSRIANLLRRASSALTFLAAMSFQHSYFCRRNGMVDVCMIGRDGVVNSNDLRAAIAQSATLRIAIDPHQCVGTRYAE
jgi:hypothetical protein